MRLTWNAKSLSADLSIVANDIETDEGLETAILISLFTDRRAEPSDILPTGSIDRRGWWADEFNESPGDRIGSRLWLLERSKAEQSVVDRAQEYGREALQWLLNDKVVESLLTVAAFTVKRDGIVLTINAKEPDKDPATYRFGSVWTAEKARV